MKKFVPFLLVFALLGLAAVVLGQVTGSTTLTVFTPSGGGSLLSGATVTSTGSDCRSSPTISTGTPAGWTLVCGQSFEGGSVGPCEIINGIGNIGHSGSHSLQGNYFGDAATVQETFNLNGGCLGSYTSLYISYWDRTDSNALFGNSDYFEVELVDPAMRGSGCWIALDGQTGSFTPLSLRTTDMVIGGAPDAATDCFGNFFWNQGRALTMDAGIWEQHEILITPSTAVALPFSSPPPVCTNASTAGCGNGHLELWINGQVAINAQFANLNGTVNWNDTQVNIGGLITSFASDGVTRCGTFSLTGGGTCPGTQPGTGAPQPFNRYIDDIIVLKQ